MHAQTDTHTLACLHTALYSVYKNNSGKRPPAILNNVIRLEHNEQTHAHDTVLHKLLIT